MSKRIDYWAKFEENTAYHIYNRGINKETIYKTEENYHFFLRKWKALILPFFDVGAYCLMPNHFHFLVWVKPVSPKIMEAVKQQGTEKSKKFINEEITYNDFLEDQFKRLFSSYALAFNTQEARTGSLFQKRFKRVIVSSEAKLLHLLAYIHHNPIHHRFVQNYEDWKFSSYAVYLSEKPTGIIRDAVLSWFSEDLGMAQQLFLKFHEEFKLDNHLEELYLDEYVY